MFSAAPARADGRAELDKARASFLARNWTDAEERLRVLLDPATGLKERSLISQARLGIAPVAREEGGSRLVELGATVGASRCGREHRDRDRRYGDPACTDP
ncbi:MAG TPA: hypothetical protein VM925_22275, partial [Labilithrix sp.]|nr:hypothetical protein [Labilithrix sp.]